MEMISNDICAKLTGKDGKWYIIETAKLTGKDGKWYVTIISQLY